MVMDMRTRSLIERVPFNNNVILNRILSFFSLFSRGQPLFLAVTQIGREELPAGGGGVVIAAIVRFLSQKKKEEEENKTKKNSRTKKLCQTVRTALVRASTLSSAYTAEFSFDAAQCIRLYSSMLVEHQSAAFGLDFLCVLSHTLGMPYFVSRLTAHSNRIAAGTTSDSIIEMMRMIIRSGISNVPREKVESNFPQNSQEK